MTIEELKKDIKSNTLKKIYIMTGEETGIRDLYIKKITEATKQEIVKVDTIAEVYTRLKNKGINNKSCIYLVQEDEEFFKLKEEKVWGQLRGKDVTIIFTYNNIDKRSKFFKYYSKEIINFEKLTTQVLAQHINKCINISYSRAIELAKHTQYYSLGLIEVEKIKQLAIINNINENQAYDLGVQEGLICNISKATIFDLINAIMDRTEVFKLQSDLKEELNEPFGLLSMLHSNFKTLLLMKSNTKNEKLDINPYLVTLMKSKINNYTLTEIKRNITLIKNVELKIKKGKLDIAHAIDYLLFGLLSKEV
jgi:DNA polymerase III delta subunit